MNIKDNERYIICPPLSLYLKPPEDMYNCKIEQCSRCKEDMWISEKKRNEKKFVYNKNCVCWFCFGRLVLTESHKGNEVEIIYEEI